jgi:hypothetical protein
MVTKRTVGIRFNKTTRVHYEQYTQVGLLDIPRNKTRKHTTGNEVQKVFHAIAI